MFHFYTGFETQPWIQTAELTSEARQAGIPVVVIVPQQYTLAAERALIRYLKLSGFFDVDVVSPLRFSQRVFSQSGCDNRTRIDVNGKNMAISHVLFQNREQLKYYESAVERQGFVDSVAQMIADMKRSHISPESLSEYQKGLSSDVLSDKYKDLSLIYSAYHQLLGDRFVDGEDVQDELLLRAPGASMVRQARIIIAGFDLLTEELSRLAVALHQTAESISIIICAAYEKESHAPANDSVQRFCEQLRERGLPYQTHDMLPAYPRPLDITHLACQLLNSDPAAFPKPPCNVHLYAAPTPYAEACRVAEEIILLHSKGYDWPDIQILSADEEHYFSVLDHVLTIYRIPHHLARKVSAAQLGPARYLLDTLGAITHHYRQEDMLRLLRNSYLPLAQDECFRLENLILQYGIKGWKFLKSFITAKDDGIALEDARQRLMNPLTALEDAIRNSECMDDALMSVMSFLDEANAFEKMNEEAEHLEEERRLTEAAQLKQVWNYLMNLLDQAHEIASREKPTPELLYNILETGLSSAEIAALPQDANSLPCGLIGHIAILSPRVTFVMGLNDGVLNSNDRSLIPDDEQQLLKEHFHTVSLNQDEKMQLKKLDILKAFYSPSESLYLSHAQALQDGTALRPLDLLYRVRRIFPYLLEDGGVTAPQGASRPYSVEPALESMGDLLRKGNMSDEWKQAWHYLSEHQPNETASLSDAFRPQSVPKPLSEELIHHLYLERITSIHRLESFAVCPLRHFLRYALKPVQRGEWAINRTDAGSFYHRALEGFTRELQTLENWPRVTKAEVTRLMDKAADGALDDLIRGVLGDSAIQKREFRQYKRLLQRVGWTFTLIAQHSSFRATTGDTELRFGYPDDGLPAVPLRLSDGSRVYVRGIIDRVERYQGDEGIAIRLIDFKTPNLNLQPEKIYWGTQLQLLIYMQAVLNSVPNGIPAGLYYFHLADPLLPDPDTQSDIEHQLAKALSLRGLTLRDASIIRLMDDGKPPISMPSLLKADGDFALNKPLATLEEMRLLIQHAGNVAARIAEGINTGEIAAAPLTFPNEDSPCSTCEAFDICRRNAANSGIVPRAAEKMNFSELMDKISAE